jgi:phosphoenolpyruvate phosphomutase
MTRKPVLFDGENGGAVGDLCALVRCLEDLGIAGVVLEDKVGPKLNSLLPDATHFLDDPACFAVKILEACRSRRSPDLAIVARIESLIAGTGVEDALHRAAMYVEAGADGILIHSKEEVPTDLFAFAAAFPAIASGAVVPPFLACVPTTYSQVTDAELHRRGLKVVIHGNQMIRAAYSAMQTSARSVLANDRSLEADSATASVMTISEHLAHRDLPVPASVPEAAS